jgi:hypothetical protein
MGKPRNEETPGQRKPRDRRKVTQPEETEKGQTESFPKTLSFKDEGKIRELARRGEAWQTAEDRQMLDRAIA